MRTLELLRALNDREVAEMDKLIAGEKRKTLQLLYKELKKYRKLSSTPANDELFRIIYNKNYTTDKSYLLRNELRLLNEVLYDFLIDRTFKEYIKQHKSTYNYWLSRSFFDRKINNAFGAEIDRFIENAKGYIKPDDGAQMQALKSLWMIYNLPKTAENVTAQKNMLASWRKEQMRAWRYQLREMEARAAYLDNTLTSITGVVEDNDADKRTPPLTLLDLSEGAEGDMLEEYLILKKHAYQTQRGERIKVMQRMLEIEKSDAYANEFGKIQSQLASLNNIAKEHILVSEFEEADKCLRESIDIALAHQLSIAPATLQNFVCNKVNTGRYQEGIAFYNEHEKEIKNGRQYIATLVGKVYCHLFLGQADEALAALPPTAQLTEPQHLTLRMVYLIAFIIRKHHDLAVNECNNISRMIKANQGSYYQSYAWINNLYMRYLHTDTANRNSRRAELEAIKAELTADTAEVRQLTITEFSVRWLLTQLQ
ncbi:MAG TPA: hypothetical protein VK154_18685 [Chitinophagales bacterium]|nr:hypothetical protein [Chitinophagales bacterium]